ncbi:MAG: hypothetical protein R3202_15275, partial [Candidatus Competibacterales bacterium]|nr:hypothetical protein [Candidatus Competibacterales bacterium]
MHRLLDSLRGRFLLGAAVIALLLLSVRLLGGEWLAQLRHTFDQVAQRTAPASSQAAQAAHTAAQLIAELRDLTEAPDQY